MKEIISKKEYNKGVKEKSKVKKEKQ